jgi:Spx/MgsR family transcriptional regulator
MITVYGLTQCDTVRRARDWLDAHGIAHGFHDFKRQGVPTQLPQWVHVIGHEALVNRRGTTWRKLDEAERETVVDAGSAAALLCAHPSAIKRPVVEWADGTVTAGFDAAEWQVRLQGPAVTGA